MKMSTFYRYCELCQVQHESREECPDGAVLSLFGDKYVSNEKAIEEIKQFETFEQMKQQLYDRVIKFMKDNDITCDETIYQTDHVIENAYDFIDALFNIVKPKLLAVNEG